MLATRTPKMSSYSRRRRRRSLLRKYGPVCTYCKKEFPEKDLTLDHVYPVSKGGSNKLTNLVLACSVCNGKKANKETITSEAA
jgi:5-methylcytosine-specific restriction endonuclease McrA